MTGTAPCTVAVVIATRDRVSLLEGALEALSRSIRPADRVVVVDSASIDHRVGEVARAAGASVVRCELPGLGRARNAGVRACEEDVVAFTDDDCLPDPEWVQHLAGVFTGETRPDFVTGSVRSDRPPPRRAAMTLALIEEDRRDFSEHDDPRHFGHGANMAWRRHALERIGGFDDTMGVGSLLRAAEDSDAFWRCMRGGGRGGFFPGPGVAHRLWRSRPSMLRSYYGYGIGAGALAVKRHRLSEPGGSTGELVRRLFVDEGVAPVWRSVRRGYQMASAADSLMFAGGLVGARRAWRLPLVEGRFQVNDGSAG